MITVLLLAVAAGVVGGLGKLRFDTGPDSFLPAGDDALLALHESASSFGGDPIVVLAESEEPRQLLGPAQLPALLELEGALAKLPDAAAVYGPATVANQIAIASQNLLAGLAGHRDAARTRAERQARADGGSDAEAGRAGDEAVAAFDLRYGSLLAQGLPAGLPTLHNPEFVNAVIFTDAGKPKAQWRFVVPSADAVAILVRPRQDLDQAGVEELLRAVRAAVDGAELTTERITVSGAPALAAELGAQMRREMPLIAGIAVGLIGACYLLVPWLSRRRHRLVPLLLTLCATALVLAAFGWLERPLSLGVIAFLPILLGIGSDFPAYLMRGGKPRTLVVTAIAVAAGFASLALSPLPFVRDLGIALAAGVLASLVLGLAGRRYLARPEVTSSGPPPQRSELTTGRRVTALVALGAVAVAGWAAFPRLDLQAQPDELAAGLPAVADATHLEEVLGASGEIRISLRGDDVATPQAIEWMRQAQEDTIRGFGNQLRVIASVPDLLRFLGPEPTPDQVVAGLRQLPTYLTAAVLRDDSREAIISMGIRLQSLDQQRRLLDELGAALPPPPDGMRADVVGLPVAAARGYALVSDDRYLTNILGLVLVGLVLLIGLTRRTDALRAVLAAALATGWGFACVWALDVALTPLTIALGSLTTVIACEYTIVLADRGGAQAARLRRTVGVAATTAVVGYLVLVVSDVSVIRDFGVLLACAVVLAFVAAHLVDRLLPMNRPNEIAVSPVLTDAGMEAVR